MGEKVILIPSKFKIVAFIILLAIFFLPLSAVCETFGIKNPQGNFIPKVTITLENKEVLIKKTDPNSKFRSISLSLNKKNRRLVQNVDLLNVQWMNRQNRLGKPLPFAGPRYNPKTRVFEDSMTKSIALKIIDKSTRDLFSGKEFSDLFTLRIDDKLSVSSESFYEKDRTVKMGAGRDLSIDVDKSSVVFDESNFKKGEIINVDNRSGYNQSLGVELPEKGLLYFQIIRKPEQTKVPRDNWDRFTVEADSGIFIVLIPEPDPVQLAELDGREIIIKVWDGNRIRETRRIPIRSAAELRTGAELRGGPDTTAAQAQDQTPATSEPSSKGTSREGEAASLPVEKADLGQKDRSRSTSSYGGLWLWATQVFNLLLLAAVGIYAIFFMLPKIQVLEDRLAKNEMFIHGSREAIRDELEEIKEDILRQCLNQPPQE